MLFFGRLNEIQHVSPNQETSQFLEIAVFLVFDLCDTPEILSSLDDLAFGSLDIFITADDGKGHGSGQISSMIRSLTIILINRRRENVNALCGDDFTDSFFEGKQICWG